MTKSKRNNGKTLADVMSKEPVTMKHSETAMNAAKQMRESNVGDILVTEDGSLCGIVTDRDLVVRCLAEGKDPGVTELGHLCSKDPVTLSKDADVSDAVELMRKKAIRRIPVVDGKIPVGIVSIGDLAVEIDRRSALAEISAAAPNR